MTVTDFEDDSRLLARLAEVAGRIDPVPAGVVAAASGSFTWRTVDFELAELVYDSVGEDSVGERELVGVRSESDGRQLSFAAREITVEMEISSGGGMVGQIVPPQPAAIQIRHRSSTTTLAADHLGRFQAAGLPSGPMSMRCRPESGAPSIATDWVLV